MIATVALMRHGGSHLIRPIVSRMGFEIIEPGNFGAPANRARGPVIVFLRDPRDRMVSTFRWWMNKPRKVEILIGRGDTDDAKLAWLLGDYGFMAEMTGWSQIWCPWPDALTVRFEDLRTDGPREVMRIAKHFGVGCDAAAVFDAVYAKGRTYTGQHSDWREGFGPLSLATWADHGGPELLEIMGYA